MILMIYISVAIVFNLLRQDTKQVEISFGVKSRFGDFAISRIYYLHLNIRRTYPKLRYHVSYLKYVKMFEKYIGIIK